MKLLNYIYIYIFNTSMYFVRKNGGNPDDNFINKKKNKKKDNNRGYHFLTWISRLLFHKSFSNSLQ